MCRALRSRNSEKYRRCGRKRPRKGLRETEAESDRDGETDRWGSERCGVALRPPKGRRLRDSHVDGQSLRQAGFLFNEEVYVLQPLLLPKSSWCRSSAVAGSPSQVPSPRPKRRMHIKRVSITCPLHRASELRTAPESRCRHRHCLDMHTEKEPLSQDCESPGSDCEM